ncbi:slipin family protein [Slackia piriformis]|uniref:slipin family protein n=1 Tax=Slackia piriformis TaxID=626934 RepID=UPI00294220D2|nr:slipin family protein [Slackia piriformis]
MEPSSKKKGSAPGSRAANSRYSEIESINSPRTRHVDDNTGTVFSAFVFAASFVTATALAALFVGGVDIWTLCFGFFMAVLAASSIHVATQWERVIVLRLGTFKRIEGPGLYFTIPFVERAVLRADMRTMLTGFGAEETLTSDLVPVDVDAAVFWMVWDPEKACMEVENYYDAVSMAAQTALRDAIGRKSISDITVHRDKLDQELRDKIEEKAGPWGISIISVEIRDIVIPKELQRDMAAAAKAEREKDARIILAEVEKDVAAMLLEATEIYREDDMAFELRSMHLLNEGVKESNGTLVIPSAYSEGFKPSRPAR